MNRIVSLLCVSGVLLTSTAGATAATPVKIDTNFGSINLILDEKKAPQTVANFSRYAQKGFYNGTIFHRVIGSFMIQGGGFDQNMNQKPTDKAINNESRNGLKNTVGTIAMARTAAPHSATSQFFINLDNNKQLDYTMPTAAGFGYAVFGKVADAQSMAVVRKIAASPTGKRGIHGDVPLKPIVIQKVTVYPAQ